MDFIKGHDPYLYEGDEDTDTAPMYSDDRWARSEALECELQKEAAKAQRRANPRTYAEWHDGVDR